MSQYQIIKLRAIESTNEYLKKRILIQGKKTEHVVWALDQTQGKAQSNKTWLSSVGNSLTFSLYKEFDKVNPSNHYIINVLVSLATIKTLNEFGVNNVLIKWSNDIMADNRKIAGLLIENFIQSKTMIGSIIGIGINVNHRQPYDNLDMTSMHMVSGQSFELRDVLEGFLKCVNQYYLEFQIKGIATLLEKYVGLLWGKEHTKKLIIGGKPMKGKLIKLNSDGNLLIELPNNQILAYHHSKVKITY